MKSLTLFVGRVPWVVFSLLALGVGSQSYAEHIPLSGQISSAHGRIRWQSTATETPDGGWTYQCEVWNEDSLNSHVRWGVCNLDSLIGPGQSILAKQTTDSPPVKKLARLFYRGGLAMSGYSTVEKAEAWAPESAASKVSSMARFFALISGDLRMIEVFGRSSYEESSQVMDYQLEIRGLTDQELEGPFSFRWTGPVPPESSRHALRFTEPMSDLRVTVNADDRIGLRQSAVGIVGSDGSLLATAAMPAMGVLDVP